MLATLKEIVQDVNNATHTVQAFDAIVNHVAKALGAEICAIYILEEHCQHFLLAAAKGFPAEAIGQVKIPLMQGLVGLVAAKAEPMNLSNAATHPHYHYVPALSEERFQSFIGVPVIHQRQVVGVLVAQNVDSAGFSEDDEAFLITLSAQLAAMIAYSQSTFNAELCGRPYFTAEPTKDSQSIMMGYPAAPGVNLGEVVCYYPIANFNTVVEKPVGDKPQEIKRFIRAIKLVKKEIDEMKVALSTSLTKEELSLFDADLQILDSNSIAKEVSIEIEKGHCAEVSLKKVVNQHMAAFQNMHDPYISARSADVNDLGLRILANLITEKPKTKTYPEKIILVGEQLSATALVEMPTDQIKGMVTTEGASNSHLTVLARALGIPMVTNLPLNHCQHWQGKKMIVDGYQGQIVLSPSQKVFAKYQRLVAEEEELMSGLSALKSEPSVTPDGYHMPLFANLGLLSSDIHMARQNGAQGVGLYRSEMIYMTRESFPSEEAQASIYQNLLSAFPSQPVTVRTLDIGGDKNLPYFPIQEDNPFLGWRGMRVTLDHPELFLIQARALLKVSAETELQILLPMISQIQQLEDAIGLLKQARQELREEGFKINMPKIGVMIEVPAMLYQLEDYAKRVDFFSVGSNDLIQYLFAVDRSNARVASYYEPLDPVVLKVLSHIVSTVHEQNKTVSICGEMASDPICAVLLMAIGFDTLSVNPYALPRIKWVIRNIPLGTVRTVLGKALLATSSNHVRTLMHQLFEQHGVGGVIRAGK